MTHRQSPPLPIPSAPWIHISSVEADKTKIPGKFVQIYHSVSLNDITGPYNIDTGIFLWNHSHNSNCCIGILAVDIQVVQTQHINSPAFAIPTDTHLLYRQSWHRRPCMWMILQLASFSQRYWWCSRRLRWKKPWRKFFKNNVNAETLMIIIIFNFFQ